MDSDTLNAMRWKRKPETPGIDSVRSLFYVFNMRLRALLAVGILIALGLCVYKFTQPRKAALSQYAAQSDGVSTETLTADKGSLRFLRMMEKVPANALSGRYIVLALKASEVDSFVSAVGTSGLQCDKPIPELGAVLVVAEDKKSMEKLASIMPKGATLEYDYIAQCSDISSKNSLSHGTLEAFDFSPGEILGCPQDVNWGKGVDVALLDMRVLPHAALASASVVQFPGRVGPGNGKPWHATALASIICGTGDNVKGIAPAVRIMSYPVLDDDGVGDAYSLVSAMVDAVKNGIQILCIQASITGDSKLLRQAVHFATESNAVVVVPCGYGSPGQYPAALEDVFCVGAIDLRANPIGNPSGNVRILAPGYGIPAAVPGKDKTLVDGSGPASALVAGILAGIMYESPGVSPKNVAEMLVSYSDRTGFEDASVPSGIVNADRVRMRSMQGLRDIAVTGVQTEPGRDGGHVVKVAVQNKGTATTAFSLDVTVGDRVYNFSSQGLPANQFQIFSVDIPEGEFGKVSARAITQAQDMNPDNNVW